MDCSERTSWIPAYLDGELDIMKSIEIEEHLETCKKCKDVYESERALQSALRSPALLNTPSSGLEARILQAVRKGERNTTPTIGSRWMRYGYAAAFAALLLAIMAVWRFNSSQIETQVIANEVLASHVRSLMANHLTDVVSSDRHTVKPWFNGKVDYSPAIEDMADQGFPLSGGRLDYLDNRPVAALVYMRQKHVINLFLWPSMSATSETESFNRRGYSLIHWKKSGFAYWLASDLNRTELLSFVEKYQGRIALHNRQ